MRWIFFVLLTSFLFGCQNNNNSVPITQDRQKLEEVKSQNTDTTLTEKEKYYYENTKIEFEDPIVFKSTQNMAVPIILEQKYVDKDMPANSYFNIAIIDTNNTVKKMLFEKSIIIDRITSFETQLELENYGLEEEGEKSKYSSEYNSLLFLDLCTYENRKRGPTQLYVYDLKNDILTKLSPSDAHVIDWRVYRDRAKVVIYYQFDSDKNGLFDEKDDENMAIVNPKKAVETKGLFDLENLKKVKVQVAKEN